MGFLLYWLLCALVLWLVAAFVPGIYLSGLLTALVVIAVFGFINMLVKPLLYLLTLPLNVLTLGLFSFVLNALLFGLGAWMVPGFEVTNFFSALVGSILLSLGTMLIAHPGKKKAF